MTDPAWHDCIKQRCYSPVACEGFGYCRELNFVNATRAARIAGDEIKHRTDISETVKDALNYDPADNTRRCYKLGLKAWREKCIRSGEIEPTTLDEHRWAAEGPRRASELEAVRNG